VFLLLQDHFLDVGLDQALEVLGIENQGHYFFDVLEEGVLNL